MKTCRSDPPTLAAKGGSVHPLLAGAGGGGAVETNDVFTRMKTTAEGLSDGEAARRLVEVGPNVVAANGHRGWPWRLLTATRNPLVILLIVLAAISFATGDVRAGSVMTLMVTIGVLLLVQEARRTRRRKLKAMINVTAAVVRRKRGGDPPQQLVPGDVELSVGTVPAMCGPFGERLVHASHADR
jgi:Mg2+-importing ATPase